MNSLVHIENLQKTFCKGNICVANNISLEIHEGEIFTVLGKSGSGKTTFLRMIAGLETPDRGAISINERVVFDAKTNVAPSSRGVAVVFQNYALLPHMSVEANIMFGGTFSAQDLHDILEKTNLLGQEKKYPHELSGGQQQRVALARALIHKPSILLLDEPLSNIDTELRAQLREELKRMIKSFGITALFITHDKEDAFYLSDRIAIMHGGDILQVGTPKEIYQTPNNLYCATFLGKLNHLFDTTYARPESIILEANGTHEARIKEVIFYGSYYEIVLEFNDHEIICNALKNGYTIGETVRFSLVDSFSL